MIQNSHGKDRRPHCEDSVHILAILAVLLVLRLVRTGAGDQGPHRASLRRKWIIDQSAVPLDEAIGLNATPKKDLVQVSAFNAGRFTHGNVARGLFWLLRQRAANLLLLPQSLTKIAKSP